MLVRPGVGGGIVPAGVACGASREVAGDECGGVM